MAQYHFYFQQTDLHGNVISGSQKDLESAFPGVSYLSFKGLELLGKPKNVYLERYADADKARVYHPSDSGLAVTREETQVSLDIVVQDTATTNRRETFNNLCNYLSGRRLYYWDTARLKKVWLVLNNAVEPTDDTLKGIKYIRSTLNFTNIWGCGKTCNANGVIA